MRTIKRWAVLPLLAMTGIGIVGGGCARSVSTTTVRPNGSWVRKIEFHGSPGNGMGAMIANGTKIEDAFVLPKGSGWTITRKEVIEETDTDKKGGERKGADKKSAAKMDKADAVIRGVGAPTPTEVIVTAVREMKLNETLTGDITAKTGGSAVSSTVVNEVSVHEIAPGKYQYRETFHWKGPIPKTLLTTPPEMIAVFKKALPRELATDVNVQDLSRIAFRASMRSLFGPGELLIGVFTQFLSQPEIAERRLMRGLGRSIYDSLQKKFGDKLTVEQRLDIARKSIHSFVTSSTNNNGPFPSGNNPGINNPGANKQGENKPDDPMSNLAAMTVIVKLPGKVTETNGETDEFSGEVYWSLYPQAAAFGDVSLTATCDTTKQAASR